MPANKNAVTRYYLIDQLLANRYHHYSIADILEKVNEQLVELGQPPVKRRSIELDINYLEFEGPFMAEIEHYTIDVPSQTNCYKTVKKSCLRYADPSYSIFKKKLSNEESYLLSEALSILGQFDGLPNLEGLESLRKSLDVKVDRQIISLDRNPLQQKTLIGELFTAISQQQVVEIFYHIFADPKTERRVVLHPYLLKEYNCRWYLIAAADTDKKLLNFGLDRIDRVVPLSTYSFIPYDGDLNERFEDIVGVSLFEDRPLQTILFWVSEAQRSYVETKPLHESQRVLTGQREDALRAQYPILVEGKFFSIECIENYELIRELTSFGKELLVLEPYDIQQKVYERISRTSQSYDALRK